VSAQAAAAERTLPGASGPAHGRPAHRGKGGRDVSGLATPAATLAVAGVLCFATFVAGGGLRLQPMTVVEIALTLGAALLTVAAVLLGRGAGKAFGLWPTALLLALSVLSALSVAWSVAPDSSWQDAGRMLAYTGVFGAAVVLARVAPRGWSALLGGVVLAATVVCVYALLTKVFPAQLDAGDVYARLQEPYGYWNAIGLTAALGATGCLWLGARRAGHGLLSACAYPAMSVSLVTVMLAYSRGALAVLVLGVALWLAIVPLRLRGARVLLVGALGAAPVVAWDFAKHALTSDGMALSARTSAGHQLGVLLAAMVLVEALAGVAIGFFSARKAPSLAARRRLAALLVAVLALALAGGASGLAVSERGFTGTITHAFKSLTDPNAPVPKNTPGRLTSAGSVRARYWKEALDVFDAHPALGAGALGYETARLRYRKETLQVKHAHGYLVQTLADLGLAGLVVTLALLASWLGCAARATRPLDRRLHLAPQSRTLGGVKVLTSLSVSWRRAPTAYTPERIGLLSMLCVVVVFGIHSLVDWTWYVPGNACVALLCAGWLAGRGPLRAPGAPLAYPAGSELAEAQSVSADDGEPTLLLPPPRRHLQPTGRARLMRRLTSARLTRSLVSTRRDPRSLVLALAAIAAGLLAAWTQWQPQRSAEDSERALSLLVRSPAAAREAAKAAVARDPLSAQALFTLSAVEHASGEAAAARATLQKAVQLQPSNPQTWLTLGQYDLSLQPKRAVQELRAAVYLDPQSIPIQNAYVEALRAAGAAAPSGGTATQRRATGGTRPRASSSQKRARRA
jgi:O-Antigen ligase